MSDRDIRSTTPLIDGQVCQRRAPRPFAGAEQDAPDNLSSVIVSDTDLHTITLDLRNQLKSLKGWTDLLGRRVEGGLGQASILDGITTIRASAEAMDDLLGELLDTSHVEAGQRSPIVVDLWAPAERLVDHQRALATGHAFTLAGPGAGQTERRGSTFTLILPLCGVSRAGRDGAAELQHDAYGAATQ